MRKQPALARKAAAIARQRSVGADEPVAWYDDGNRIGAVRQSDRTHGLRPPESRGQGAVARGLAGGNASQRGPHGALKRRAVGFSGELVDTLEIAVKIGA